MSDYQWRDGSGYGLELRLREQDVESVPQSGAADESISWLMRDPHIKGQMDSFAVRPVAEHLSEYGAWDAIDLADHDVNLSRVLWLAICDVREMPEDYAIETTTADEPA